MGDRKPFGIKPGSGQSDNKKRVSGSGQNKNKIILSEETKKRLGQKLTLSTKTIANAPRAECGSLTGIRFQRKECLLRDFLDYLPQNEGTPLTVAHLPRVSAVSHYRRVLSQLTVVLCLGVWRAVSQGGQNTTFLPLQHFLWGRSDSGNALILTSA